MPAPQKNAPGKHSVTMRDVAKLAKVSQSTVSRVLNGTKDGISISEETQQRVMEAIETLGYYPNLHAGSLRGQKTRMIAMMIADIANPFYHPMVRAVQDVAATHGYDVMITNTDHMVEGEMHFIEAVIRRPVDGMIMVPYYLTDNDFERLVTRTGAPVAVLGQHVNHPRVDTVYGTDDQAIIEAITWLIQERGHQHIGYIGVTNMFAAGTRRKTAFMDALRQAGRPIEPQLFEMGDWSPDSGERAMQSFLALPQPPTAVFAVNDLMAIGAMEAVQKAGLRIPEDIAIIGFDDIPPAVWVRPRLTTIAQYPAEIGRVMAEALFERLQGDYSGPNRRFEVPCRLVVRESA
ncbi:MAG: LacI family DNA-binding transcriptional regulator [Caldilineaceae bacterium]|nr:LacI family DNA-binding transcriptional regulator [Caldilineaceae bacterium]MBP8106904.1 LacI family DNA-binding transcriptional regulator [Caldilineaceae bacterium]MBP8121824.1 LacI family DNA-binding transcriptional regulator [Caldilineaceae bacterium]MBP9072124.1 LacI family DNA-binding transcriptional regulator [Caldilineaceae bacterium]